MTIKLKKFVKSRAAILPTPGDPYLNALWLSSYKKIWKDEVDKLYVCLNSGMDKEIIDYVGSLYKDSGCEVLTNYGYLNHGVAIQECLLVCKEKDVLLLEDDFYILEPGHVNRWFSVIEQGQADAVASLRASCGQELHKRIVDRFKLKGPEVEQPNFWPCLFVSNKKILLATSQWFDAFDFEANTYCKDLDWTPSTMQSGDTFVKTSIELRNKNLKFHFEPQYRNTTHDFHLYPQRQGMFASNLPWTHFGSSSTSLNSSLQTPDGKPLGSQRQTFASDLPCVTDDHIREDYERRVALWEWCWKLFPIEDPKCSYFNQVYGDAIKRLKDGCKLREDKIAKFQEIYKEVLGKLL